LHGYYLQGIRTETIPADAGDNERGNVHLAANAAALRQSLLHLQQNAAPNKAANQLIINKK
jgi:hypothetical protein